MVHRLGRPDGSQPGPPRRGGRPRSRTTRRRLASPTIIEVMLADDRRSWQLQPDATWVRTEVLEGREGTIDTFEALKEDALAHGSVVADAASPRRRRRLAGPARMSPAIGAPGRGRAEVPRRRPRGRRALPRRRRRSGRSAGTSAPRSSQLEDRYVDTADGAMARAGFAVRLRQSGRGTIVSIKSLARADGRRRGDAPRGARGTGRPDRRAARLAAVGRPLARPRARRRRAARRARHDPPAPPQAASSATATRASS